MPPEAIGEPAGIRTRDPTREAGSDEARQLIARNQTITATISAATAISNSHCRLFCARRLKIVLTRRSVRTPKPLSSIW